MPAVKNSPPPLVKQSPEEFEAGQKRLETIKRLFEEEKTKPLVPKTAEDIPPNYEAVTDEWLTAILGRDVPGAKVTEHSLDKVDSGAVAILFV